MYPQTVGVFPATGGLATSIINHLRKNIKASNLILIAHHPERLDKHKSDGATVRHADYDEPETLHRAFSGVNVLVLISYPSIEIEHRFNVRSHFLYVHQSQANPLSRFKAHKAAINSAFSSGVEHIFYSSLGFGGQFGETSVAQVMGAHLETEKYLMSHTGNQQHTFTSIRMGLYSESFPIYTSWFSLDDPADEVAIPHNGDGPGVAWVKRDELGEATAQLVCMYTWGPSGFPYTNGKVYLSGPREISLKETVEILGKAVGKPVGIREISVDEYTQLPQHGTKFTHHGKDLTREWTTAWEAIRQGETAHKDDFLKQLIGREPESFETTINALAGKK